MADPDDRTLDEAEAIALALAGEGDGQAPVTEDVAVSLAVALDTVACTLRAKYPEERAWEVHSDEGLEGWFRTLGDATGYVAELADIGVRAWVEST